MSLHTQSLVASVNSPALGKARDAYLSTKNAKCYTDANGAQWWYGEQRVVLTADNAGTGSATLADITGLSFTVLASTRYAFKFGIIYSTSVSTSGLKLSLTCPASPTVISAATEIFGQAADGVSSTWQGMITASADAVVATDANVANTSYFAIMEGVLVNGVNAGTLQAQYANEGAAGTVLIKQGSYGRLWLE